jgi:hypothetical protein
VTIDYWIDEGWYVGRLRGVAKVFSQAETLGELEANIRDALPDDERSPAYAAADGWAPTSITRTSITLVPVGPVLTSPFERSKK